MFSPINCSQRHINVYGIATEKELKKIRGVALEEKLSGRDFEKIYKYFLKHPVAMAQLIAILSEYVYAKDMLNRLPKCKKDKQGEEETDFYERKLSSGDYGCSWVNAEQKSNLSFYNDDLWHCRHRGALFEIATCKFRRFIGLNNWGNILHKMEQWVPAERNSPSAKLNLKIENFRD